MLIAVMSLRMALMMVMTSVIIARRQQEILASGMIDLQNINNSLQSQLETTRETLRETQIRQV